MLKYCYLPLLLAVIPAVSSQDLSVTSHLNSSRIVGHGSFLRTCTYSGNKAFEYVAWLHNESEIQRDESNDVIRLNIRQPQYEMGGEYHCVIQLSDGVRLNISAGYLNVYSTEHINVPAIQEVVAGSNITLECSSDLPEATSSSWSKLAQPANIQVSNPLIHVTLQQQGEYECVIEDESTGNLVFLTTINLRVIASPQIISWPTVKEIYSNEPANFTVDFLSSFEADTTVMWQLNGLPLTIGADFAISTQYYVTNESIGSTTLCFPQLTRTKEGIYSVIIENSRILIPPDRSNARVRFRIDVYVPPTAPTTPVFETFNSSLSRITWNLTNSTADAGPHSIIVNIDGHPTSLPPSQRFLLLPTEPGRTYIVNITAINIDSSMSSQPAHLILPAEAPLLTIVATIRLNETAFNFTVEVQHTGSGSDSLTLVDIMFREVGTNVWIRHHQSLLHLMKNGGETWYMVVSNGEFASIQNVEFSFSIQNNLNRRVHTMTRQVIVLPGPPEDINARTVTINSLTLEVRLSSIGTSPLLSVEFALTVDGGTPIFYNISEDVSVGGVVVAEITGLSPATSYSVIVCATNDGGKGLPSMVQEFQTSEVASMLPLWIILVISVVGTLMVLILLLLLLISCCCRRRNDRPKKINLASSTPRHGTDRPGPLGASDSLNSLHVSSNYCHGEGNFVLAPPPLGYPSTSPHIQAPFSHSSPTNSSNVGKSPYHCVKPHLQNSPLESEISIHSSKYNHFNFYQSPVPPQRLISIDQYSQSMPVLDNPDLSPTIPPNCATDV